MFEYNSKINIYNNYNYIYNYIYIYIYISALIQLSEESRDDVAIHIIKLENLVHWLQTLGKFQVK